MKYVSHGPADTARIAANLATDAMARLPELSHASVIALTGELGSGKTTFAQAFAAALGVVERPTSPTFTLMRRYDIPDTGLSLWHLDCYRLEHREELAPLDLGSVIADPRNIVLVEWPEKAMHIFPRDHIVVRFTHEGGDKRGITVDTQPK